MVSSAYKYLSEVDVINNQANSKFLCLKTVPLKIFIFVWRLILNRISAKDNLVRRRILVTNDHKCVTNYGVAEDIDHLL